MTPTNRMLQIEEIRKERLENQTSKILIDLINEVADELHDKEMQMYKLIQAQNEGRNENENGKTF